MFCRNCGAKNDDGLAQCYQCGNVMIPGGQTPPAEVEIIPNHLVLAIVAASFGGFCCQFCLPAGITAIVFASQVNEKIALKDYAGARLSSKRARMWSVVSFWVAGGFWLLYLCFLGAMLAFGFWNKQ